MNHAEAIESNAAEAYLLGDLPEAERNAFEEHYIDCRICSATVQEGATMMAAGQLSVKVKPFPAPKPMKWLLASAAAAAIVIVSFDQGVEMRAVKKTPTPQPRGQTARTVPEVPKITAPSRGANPPLIYRGDELVPLDIVPDPEVSLYKIELRDSNKRVIQTMDATEAEVDNGEVSLKLERLPVGKYDVVVRGVRKDGTGGLINVINWDFEVKQGS